MPDKPAPEPQAPQARGGRAWLRRRRPRAASAPAADGRNRFERVLFSFMGPPELGDVHAPVRQLPPAPVLPCPTCGEPYDRHEVVRDPRLTYTRCPPPSS